MTTTDTLSDLDWVMLARRSPNVFAAFVLGFEQAPVHKRIQRFLGRHDDCYAEFHRGMGKTQQVGPVRCCWEIGKNPEVRIKYVQQNDPEAAKTTRQMKQVIKSERYRMVFPNVVPDDEQWAGHMFSVKTKHFRRDATVEAKGIFGRAGGRYDILVGDDVCDWKNSIKSPTDRESVKDAWATNWLPMKDLSADRHPRIWKIGTPYHVDDITAAWRHRHGQDGSLLRMPVVDFQSPWRDVFTVAELQALRAELGPVAYARAYELQPVSSEQIIFPAAWLDDSLAVDIGRWESHAGEMVATFDFAFSEKTTTRRDTDPDWSVCLIGWRSRNGHVWPRDIVRMRATFPEFMRAAIKRCVDCGVKQGRGEGNGPQLGLVQQANQMAPFPITSIPRDTDKVSRAVEKQAFVESGRFHLRAVKGSDGVLRPSRDLQVVYDEMVTFPASGHDDCVDAALDLMGMATDQTTGFKAARIGNTRKEPMSMYS